MTSHSFPPFVPTNPDNDNDGELHFPTANNTAFPFPPYPPATNNPEQSTTKTPLPTLSPEPNAFYILSLVIHLQPAHLTQEYLLLPNPFHAGTDPIERLTKAEARTTMNSSTTQEPITGEDNEWIGVTVQFKLVLKERYPDFIWFAVPVGMLDVDVGEVLEREFEEGGVVEEMDIDDCVVAMDGEEGDVEEDQEGDWDEDQEGDWDEEDEEAWCTRNEILYCPLED